MSKRVIVTSCLILVCGLIWSNITLAQCPIKKRCQQSLVFSKNIKAEKPDCFEHLDCSTDTTNACDDCIMRMQWKAEITRDTDNDETSALIPNGSKIKFDSVYHIRTVGPCETPVGTHIGRFKVVSPSGGLVAIGRIKGTNGLKSRHTVSGECCEQFHGEGLMEGRFLRTAVADRKCKKFTATYSSSVDPTGAADKVCDPEYWKNWQLHIAGIVLCKCPQPEEES